MTLGQVAFNARRKAAPPYRSGKWGDLKDVTKRAWEKTARAVVREYTRGIDQEKAIKEYEDDF